MIIFKAEKDIKKGEWLVAVEEKSKVEIAFNEDIGVSIVPKQTKEETKQ